MLTSSSLCSSARNCPKEPQTSARHLNTSRDTARGDRSMPNVHADPNLRYVAMLTSITKSTKIFSTVKESRFCTSAYTSTCSTDVYLGPPDIIAQDAGMNFMARAFQSNADMLHVKTRTIPANAEHSMCIVECYHSPLLRAVNNARQEAPDVDKNSSLQMILKCINDSVCPCGIVAKLLLLGTLSRLGLPNDPPTPSTLKRAIALRKAAEAMSCHSARGQAPDALPIHNGPDVLGIHSRPIGSPILVYLPEKDMWEGPFFFLDLHDEDATVQLPPPLYLTKFRTNLVKPYLTDTTNSEVPTTSLHDTPTPQQRTQHVRRRLYVKRPNSLILTTSSTIPSPVIKLTAHLAKTDFTAARNTRFTGLVENGVFALVPASAASGHRIYSAHIVDHVKIPDTPFAFAKSRFVVQAFNDKGNGLPTNARSVQWSSQ